MQRERLFQSSFGFEEKKLDLLEESANEEGISKAELLRVLVDEHLIKKGKLPKKVKKSF